MNNLYKALRLLADTATGGIVSSLAREGGLKSTMWAGPEKLSRDMRAGRVPVQGTMRKDPVRLKLGFAGGRLRLLHPFGSSGTLQVGFALDPEIKRECIWSGPLCKPELILVDRSGTLVRAQTEKGWQTLAEGLRLFETIMPIEATGLYAWEALHSKPRRLLLGAPHANPLMIMPDFGGFLTEC